MNIIAIDPGYGKHSGGNAVAVFVDERLEAAKCVRFVSELASELGLVLDYGGLDAVVIEKPQQDGRSRTTPPAVLIELTWHAALLGGVLAGGYPDCSVFGCTPTQWKGSEQKPVHHERMWRELSPDERGILGGPFTGRMIGKAVEKGALDRWGKPGAAYYPRNNTTHNLLDAAALGLWHLSRLEKRG